MAKSVCICGSMTFIDEMEAMALPLETLGYQVTTPAREESGLQWSKLPNPEAKRQKKSFVDGYLAKIRYSDVVLIANFRKHRIDGYVGPNTLMEAAFSYALGIPVIFLHDPADQACGLECISIAHGCLNGDINSMASVIGDSP